MPKYTYTDDDHTTTMFIPINEYDGSAVICNVCGSGMNRQYESTYVSWGGIPPSAGDRHPEVQHFIDTEEERRDKYLEEKENGND